MDEFATRFPSWMDGSLTGAVNQNEVESFFTFSVASLLLLLSLSLSLYNNLKLASSRKTLALCVLYYTLILHTVRGRVCHSFLADMVLVGGDITVYGIGARKRKKKKKEKKN